MRTDLLCRGLVALAVAFTCAQARAEAGCEIHLRPAAALTSVGEDFDQVKRVGQDLRDYGLKAGKPLEWLTPERQYALLQQQPPVASGPVVAQLASLTRQEALQPRAAPSAAACALEVATPQIILERGGLATRSLRVFGVVRRFENGAQVKSFSGFASAPMAGFRLRGPDDLPAATALVEQAYRTSIQILLQSSAKPANNKGQP